MRIGVDRVRYNTSRWVIIIIGKGGKGKGWGLWQVMEGNMGFS